ncbi:MAG: hypothetical protein MIO92_11440 [Methanosarcinaceae archaeon]|nr:hypothetical protein [Methanosarcinaceae archaeon]
MITPLEERIKNLKDTFELGVEREKKWELLLDLIKTTDLFEKLNENSANISFYSYRWGATLYIRCPVDVQEVEDEWCSIIHQSSNCDWKMEIKQYEIELVCQPFKKYEDFSIKITEFPTCKIKKVIKRILTDEELDGRRIEYNYYINCGDGEIHRSKEVATIE